MLRRGGIVAAALALLALILLISGHWILGIIVGLIAAVAIWIFLQARTVR
ncbi:MAG TPA: hypothetical protein VFU10_09770 [Gaiellaceae bacterium]|nr:hypothetical protein [Gaiellaceae bacterium]